MPSAILVQLFFSSDNLEWINQVTDAVLTVMPEAIVVGATTDGEIANGKTLTNSTVFSLSVFAKTTLRVVADTCLPGEELALGEGLRDQLLKQEQQIAGVLFLATPLSINVSRLLDGLASGGINFPCSAAVQAIMPSWNTALLLPTVRPLTVGRWWLPWSATIWLSRNIPILAGCR